MLHILHSLGTMAFRLKKWKHYDAIEFSDWTHKLSKAPMLKAQHPDYEVYTMGVHAKRGVACTTVICHTKVKVGKCKPSYSKSA